MDLNKQRPEKQAFRADGKVELHHLFSTLQGEGPFAGVRSIFVRLAGCNLQCPFCDTEYTSQRELLSAGELAARVTNAATEALWHERRYTNAQKLVVITGGEPLRQNIGPLCSILVNSGYAVQIESNGVFAPGDELLALLYGIKPVWLCVSPKTSRINGATAAAASYYKYVLAADQIDPADGLPLLALGHKAAPRVARPPKNWQGDIFVNPMDAYDDTANAENLKATVQSATAFGYRMGVQLHKVAGLE